MKKLLLLLFSCLTIFAIAGCGGNGAQDGSLRYALEAEPASIDPAMSTNIPSSNVELQLFDGLTRLDEKGAPQSADAEKWTVSADGLVYTFTLRDGLVWSDGKPLTAHDYEYAWKRVLDPATGSPNAYMLYPIKNGEAYFNKKVGADAVGVKALDNKTLQVTLENPTAYFLGLTAFHAYYPVPKAVVEKDPKTWASEAKTFVGNGPFTLTSWAHKSNMVFAKNTKYWDAQHVTLESMDWPISESQKTRLTLVENGQADMMVEPPMVDQQRLTDKGIFHIAPYLGTYYYVFNTQAAPFNDVRVRKALALAIDRENLLKNVVKGGKTAAYAFVPPGLKDARAGKDFREVGGNLTKQDVSEAKRLLEEAGYGPNHPLPTVTLLYNTNELHKAIAEAMQAMWKETLGIDVQLVNQETKVYFASREEGNFQIAKASWIADYADPQSFMDVFYDQKNDARMDNPAYRQLVETAHTSLDASARMTAMHEAEKMLFDEAIVIPIYFTTQPYVATDRIGGYTISNLGTIDFKHAFIKQK